ncbi:MAG: DNA polymerase I [Anaerolineales bacterium]|nr:DNA polymerase I [Anaerolineales bacterium]
MAKKELVLIDGHALAYRMFYALPLDRFNTRAGEPTNATFGFVRTLMDIVFGDDPPEYMAVSFDVGKTFRDDLYPEYKATRAKTPDELHMQVDRIREIIQAFHIPIIEKEGFEADDVLGTIARQATEMGVPTRILTGDRDLLQLVNEKTHILLSGRKGIEEYDSEAVKARYGIRPDQIVDFKAMVGDSSDNIPGVRGVGEKTAASLLNKYETLENIFQNVENISSARFRNAITEGESSAYLSRKLARIVTDVPVDLDLESCRTGDYDRERLVQLMRELEFRTFSERLRETSPAAGQQLSLFETAVKPAVSKKLPSDASVSQLTYQVVLTKDHLKKLVEKLGQSEIISFDTETTSVDEITADLVGIALSSEPGEGYYVPVGHQLPEDKEKQLPLDLVIEAIRPVLTDPNITKTAHNAKYDYTLLHRYGIDVSPITFDTMLAAWLLEPSSRGLGLKNQAWMRLNVEMTEIKSLIGEGKSQTTMAQVPIFKAGSYAAADVDMPLRLKKKMEPELEEKHLWNLFTTVEMPLIPVLSDMELTGVLLDSDYLKSMSSDLADRLQSVESSIYRIAGHSFNINSTQQLSDVLFIELQLPTEGLRKTSSGRYSTAADVLDQLVGAHEVIDLILQHREMSKLKSTYVDALPEIVNPATRRIHTSYNQAGAITGRIASSQPNLQNIPIRTEMGRLVRRAFVARPGCQFLAADYSQVELRVLAHICQDPALLDAFENDQDIHATTAATVNRIPIDQVTTDQRRFAKSVNFGLLYGMSAFRLARESDLTLDEATKFVEAYFASFPNVRGYLNDTIRLAKEQGWIETVLGRRRYFPVLERSSSGRTSALARQRAEREAVNFPIQGTAADIIKIAMINLHHALIDGKFESKMILQVHDELVLEVPDNELEVVKELVVNIMAQAYRLRTELKVDTKVGHNWLDMN